MKSDLILRKRGLIAMGNDYGHYVRREIDYNIDTVTQLLMKKYYGNKDKWNVLMEMQSMLKEQFDITE